MLSYANTHYTIKYSAPLGLVELIWHGFVTSEQLQEGLQNVLDVILEKKATCLLADALRLNAIKASDQTWIKSNYFPKLAACGLKKFAHVTHSDIFTQAIISNFMKLVQDEKKFSFELQSFYDREDALDWILSDLSTSVNTL